MKRFQAFHGGPKDGHLEYHPALGPFPAQVLIAFAPPVTSWRDTPDSHTPVTYTTGVYLLASTAQSRQHGGMVATYRWQRQPGARRQPRSTPTVAELQRLVTIMATHPDLTGGSP